MKIKYVKKKNANARSCRYYRPILYDSIFHQICRLDISNRKADGKNIQQIKITKRTHFSKK